MIVNRTHKEKEFVDAVTKQLLQSNFLNQLHIISDPAILAQELTKINSQERNKEDDEKLLKSLTNKLSQPNEISNFKKLKETGVADVLSQSYVETFHSNFTFLDFLKSSFSIF